MGLTAAITGGTGFIGSECAKALRSNGAIRFIPAPRFRAGARSVSGLRAAIEPREVDRYAERYLDGVDVIVNAAGNSGATSTDLSSLLGANTVLPFFLARAGAAAGVARLVHISSAAVQGRMTLSESEKLQPENHYAMSKALGEVLLRDEDALEIVRYRPTSVQGPNRAVTKALLRLAQSPMAVVAAPGNDPSPQMPVRRAAEAVRLMVESTEPLPPVVLHPWEGATTRSVLADLGDREPRMMSWQAARRAKEMFYAVGTGVGGVRAYARRLDMMLFGQEQADGWLSPRLGPLPFHWLLDLRSETLAEMQGQRI